MWHGHQLDATKNYRAVNPSVLHDASSEGILIRRSFAIRRRIALRAADLFYSRRFFDRRN